MSRVISCFLVLVLTTCSLFPFISSQALVEESSTRVIVKLKPSTLLTSLLQSILVSSVSGTLLHTYSGGSFTGIAINLPNAATRLLSITTLLTNPLVECVIPDTKSKIDAQMSQTVPIANSEQLPTGVERIQSASDAKVSSTPNVAVAVIDTGIDLGHPDLPSSRHGINCVNRGAQSNDDNGHGTAVAGIIAGANNGQGVVGVAPNTRLYSVKVADANGFAWTSDVICGLDWIGANQDNLNIQVASMSIGFFGSTTPPCGVDPLHTAVTSLTSKGVLLVVSAGNNNRAIQTAVPASYNEVFAVTAISDTDGKPGGVGAASCSPGESDDAVASYSNYANGYKDNVIAAPGTCIYTTYLRSISSYRSVSGTSFAAPHVSGVIALCIANGQCNGKSPSQIKSIVLNAANTANTQISGYGFTGSSSATYYGPLVYANAF